MVSKQNVSVLVVDNQDSARRELRHALEAAADEFKFEVVEATSVDEYHDAVRSSDFDVLIVDLVVDGSNNIIETQSVHSPGTITVIYSAFGDLDPISTCVSALRAGAVDCIHKAREDSAQAVVESVCRELNALNSPETPPTSQWLEQHEVELRQKYGGRAVAFVGTQVVDDAATVGELRKKLRGVPLAGPPFLMVVPRAGEPA